MSKSRKFAIHLGLKKLASDQLQFSDSKEYTTLTSEYVSLLRTRKIKIVRQRKKR